MLHKLSDFLNTRGAAILILIFMTLVGAFMLKHGIEEGSRMFHDSFIALLAILSPAALAATVGKKSDAEITVQK